MGETGQGRWDSGAAGAWFRSAAAHPLLDPREEQRLATAVQGGRAAEAALARRLPGDAGRLRERAEAGRAAAERLVCCNLRLVAKIAMDHRGCGMPLEDLIAEGAIGARVAAERFRPGAGAKFSTYASFWIRQRIRRALCDQGRTVRLPVHASATLIRARRARESLAGELGREPTEDEIAIEIGVSPGSLRRIARGALEAVSLDGPIGDGDNGGGPGALGEMIRDPGAPDPSAAAETAQMLAELPRALAALGAREAGVLRMRFGLQNGGGEMTLEQVGAAFGVSRERIRQIQAAALARLRLALGLGEPGPPRPRGPRAAKAARRRAPRPSA